MFEKEAEEYLDTESKYLIEDNEGNIINIAKKVKQSFKDGAELGYNKVNEWHFVKDGKLPKDNEYVLIYTDLKNTYVARIPTEKDYFITRRGGFVQMSAVIAWKEIVLPKELVK